MNKRKKFPLTSMGILILILVGCLLPDIISPYDPSYMELKEINQKPDGNHFFGTDNMGRDIFSMIWHGGQVSLFIGAIATLISTSIALTYGCISGLSNKLVDSTMMRLTEILLVLPTILIIIFFQAILGEPTALSLAVVIGLTGWMPVAKVVRTEVRQIRNSEYILSARLMGGTFYYVLFKHLLPNVWSAILFMVVMNVGYAVGTEATLSFLGLGLPMEVISWGSMISLSEGALLSGYWWIILIPGIFLVSTLLCINNIADFMRKQGSREFSNLH